MKNIVLKFSLLLLNFLAREVLNIIATPLFSLKQEDLEKRTDLARNAVQQILFSARLIASFRVVLLFPASDNSMAKEWSNIVSSGLEFQTVESHLLISDNNAGLVNFNNQQQLGDVKHSSQDELVVVILGIKSDHIPLNLFRNEVENGNKYYLFYRIRDSQGLLEHRSISHLKFKAEIEMSRHSENNYNNIPSARVWTWCHYCKGGKAGRVKRIIEESELATFPEIFPHFSSNMNGTVLRVASSIGLDRSIRFQKTASGSVQLNGGFSNTIFRCLQQKYNFRYSVTLRNGFGVKLSNGTFSGIVGALQREEAEYTMDIGSSVDRYKTVTFMPMTVYAGAVFFTRVPSYETDWNLVHRPFTSVLWMSLLLCTIMVALIEISLISFVRLIVKDKCEISYPAAFIKSVGYLVRHMMEQSTEDPKEDRYRALKAIGIAWVFSSVIITTAYKAKLTMLRAYPPEESIPKTFEELVDSRYQIILHHVGGIFLKGFETSNNPALKRVAERLVLEKSLLKCFQAAISSQAACITMNVNGVFAGYKNFSSVNGELMLRMSNDHSFPLLGGPAVRRGAVFATEFAKTIRNLFDMGLVSRFQEAEERIQRSHGILWARGREFIEGWRRTRPEGPEPIVVRELLVLFLVVCLAATAALLVFVGELFGKKLRMLPLRQEFDKKTSSTTKTCTLGLPTFWALMRLLHDKMIYRRKCSRSYYLS